MNDNNKVNMLDGKNWLKNAVNFYSFDNFDVLEIQKRFESFCYKERTTGEKFLYNQKYKISEYDFSFQYIKKLNDLEKAFNIIVHSAYNSYHILLLDDVIIDNVLVSKVINDFINDYELEYRGKIVIHINSNDDNKVSFMILNRCNKKFNYIKPDYFKYEIKINETK
jgi:hypothetical protein